MLSLDEARLFSDESLLNEMEICKRHLAEIYPEMKAAEKDFIKFSRQYSARHNRLVTLDLAYAERHKVRQVKRNATARKEKTRAEKLIDDLARLTPEELLALQEIYKERMGEDG